MRQALLILCVVGLGCSETEKTVLAPTTDASIKVKVADDLGKAAYEQAKAEYSSGTASKEVYVGAVVRYATATMNGPGAPREKYPLALKLYDEALKLDPHNKEASENRQLILDIYESLGKEPPKG